MTDTLRLVPPAAEAAANDGPAGGRRRVRISLLPDRHPDAGTLNPILRMIGPAISAACLAHDNRVVLDTLAAVYVGMAQALGARGPAVAQLQTMLAQLQPPRPPAAAAAEAEHPATAAAAERQAMPMPDHGDRQPVGQARQAKLEKLAAASDVQARLRAIPAAVLVEWVVLHCRYALTPAELEYLEDRAAAETERAWRAWEVAQVARDTARQAVEEAVAKGGAAFARALLAREQADAKETRAWRKYMRLSRRRRGDRS